jgi:hypothetical protein
LEVAVMAIEKAVRFFAIVAAAGLLAIPHGWAAGDAAIKVNWNYPELKSFTADREALRSAGVEPEVDAGLANLQVPVLAFEQPPEVVTRNLRAGPEEVERAVHSDPANPVWYQIVEDYGDVSVSVSADLRAQHTSPADFPIYDKPAPGAAVDGGDARDAAPSVSVMDEAAEEGMEGYIAEYTITRYGVPYTVTIECTEAAKDQCKDKAQLAKDSVLLKLVAGGPPQ